MREVLDCSPQPELFGDDEADRPVVERADGQETVVGRGHHYDESLLAAVMCRFPEATNEQLSEMTGWSRTTIKRYLRKFRREYGGNLPLPFGYVFPSDQQGDRQSVGKPEMDEAWKTVTGVA